MAAAPEKANNPDAVNDHDIIVKVLQGDVNAYGLLVKRYQVPVYNLLLRMLNSQDEAEELLQLVFIKAYEALPRFRFEFRFFSWLYRIAINQALAHLKQQKRFTSIVGMEQLAENKDDTESEKEILVSLAIKQLSEKYRLPVILKYYQQLSYKDIAYLLGIPEKKIRSRLYDARIQLKKILKQTDYFSSV